ncbi:hypothetical protein N7509_009278 [Penicillium cosmopolitanum]|uniref:Zn(2)-C6 fungal-type domain-containing protein n=1 Tax=Penicillium cosmopolitanum TaxID=1131564 RepID=A0A9X0B3H6_9EURO|nr:uncharacterized protein N7509_009278 [Penicillium cosmopolitanum]KAJ5386737.1 hypothetical protein N7509_009278 [Penicillium cosmopolitanum]
MEDFLPREYLFTPPVHSSPDSMDLSMPDISMLPRPKKTRRGKYDPERDYSAELRRRFHENPSGKRTSRACDRCKCRKLPCDGNPESCNNCVRQGTACNMTDTSTGQTHPRNIIRQLNRDIGKLQRQLREKDQQIHVLNEQIRNLLPYHQSPGAQLGTPCEYQPSQDRGIMRSDQGITPQQLERQTPYMSGQDLV